MQWRDDTTLPSRGLGLRPIGKSSECFRMTAGVKSGKAQNERMFFRFAPESGQMADFDVLKFLPGLLVLSILLSPICQRCAEFYECHLRLLDCCCFVSAEIMGGMFHEGDRSIQFPNSRGNTWMVCRLASDRLRMA